MKTICDLNKCTGCGACANKCPHECITMQADDGLGHLYPAIDQNSCVGCGICKKVCPSMKDTYFFKPRKAYAGWFKNESDYIASTSGGAATAFSQSIISEGGVVYGCSMQPEIKACHIRVDCKEDLNKLRGSKYVQSFIGSSYKSVKKDLDSGKKVLFVGTPCQIAGLKSYLGLEQEKLYTIDLVCHGVPSNKLLEKEILSVTKGVYPDDVIFRKDSKLLMSLIKDGREIYSNSLFNERYKNIYFNAFFDGYTYRNSCHACKYASSKRISDITIGDFWGAESKSALPLKHEHGCSLILVNNAKGQEMVSGIKDIFFLFERNIDDAIQGNAQLRSPKKANIRIKIFKKTFKLLGVSFAYRLCVCDKIFKKKIRSILNI